MKRSILFLLVVLMVVFCHHDSGKFELLAMPNDNVTQVDFVMQRSVEVTSFSAWLVVV